MESEPNFGGNSYNQGRNYSRKHLLKFMFEANSADDDEYDE